MESPVLQCGFIVFSLGNTGKSLFLCSVVFPLLSWHFCTSKKSLFSPVLTQSSQPHPRHTLVTIELLLCQSDAVEQIPNVLFFQEHAFESCSSGLIQAM